MVILIININQNWLYNMKTGLFIEDKDMNLARETVMVC